MRREADFLGDEYQRDLRPRTALHHQRLQVVVIEAVSDAQEVTFKYVEEEWEDELLIVACINGTSQ